MIQIAPSAAESSIKKKSSFFDRILFRKNRIPSFSLHTGEVCDNLIKQSRNHTIEEIFNKIDRNRDGKIDLGEIEDLFERKGLTKGFDELWSVLITCDKDGDGKINLSEFSDFMTSIKQKRAIYDRMFKSSLTSFGFWGSLLFGTGNVIYLYLCLANFAAGDIGTVYFLGGICKNFGSIMILSFGLWKMKNYWELERAVDAIFDDAMCRYQGSVHTVKGEWRKSRLFEAEMNHRMSKMVSN